MLLLADLVKTVVTICTSADIKTQSDALLVWKQERRENYTEVHVFHMATMGRPFCSMWNKHSSYLEHLCMLFTPSP